MFSLGEPVTALTSLNTRAVGTVVKRWLLLGNNVVYTVWMSDGGKEVFYADDLAGAPKVRHHEP